MGGSRAEVLHVMRDDRRVLLRLAADFPCQPSAAPQFSVKPWPHPNFSRFIYETKMKIRFEKETRTLLAKFVKRVALG